MKNSSHHPEKKVLISRDSQSGIFVNYTKADDDKFLKEKGFTYLRKVLKSVEQNPA